MGTKVERSVHFSLSLSFSVTMYQILLLLSAFKAKKSPSVIYCGLLPCHRYEKNHSRINTEELKRIIDILQIFILFNQDSVLSSVPFKKYIFVVVFIGTKRYHRKNEDTLQQALVNLAFKEDMYCSSLLWDPFII